MKKLHQLDGWVNGEFEVQETEGKLRVYNIVNPPSEPMYFYVETPEEAINIINQEANYQLGVNRIFMNVFGLEVFEHGEWTEWYHPEEGMDIDNYADFLDEVNESIINNTTVTEEEANEMLEEDQHLELVKEEK